MKKKNVVKLLMVLTLMLPLTFLSACSSTPDEKELFKEVYEQSGNLKSANIKMNASMKMKAVFGDSTIKAGVNMEADFDISNDPISGHGKMTMNTDFLGMEESAVSEMYIVNKEDALYTYQNTNDEGWVVSLSEPYGKLSESEELPPFDDEFYEYFDLKAKNGEKVNGQATWRLDVTVKSDKLKDLMDDVEGADSATDTLKGLEDMDITFTLFVDKETKQVLKISMDLKDSFSDLIGKNLMDNAELEGYEISFEELKFDIVFSKINEVDAVEVPDEVSENAIQDGSMSLTTGDTSTQTHAWETMKVVLDGNEITLGETKLQTLLDMGYVIDTEYYEVADELEEYDTEYLSLLKGDISLSVSVENLGESTIKLNEGVITDLSGDTENIVLPANIKVGSSKEEVLAAYGEANSIDTSYLEYWNYEMYNENMSAYLTLNFEDEKVSDINIYVYKF